MVNIRLAVESDRDRWDAYVHSHPTTTPYHLFGWGRAIEQTYGHKSYYFIAEEQQSVVGILPAIHLKFPFLVNELVSLPFCDTGGCIFSKKEVCDKILSEIISCGKQINADKIILRGRLDSSNLQHNNLVKVKHNKVRLLLDLPESSDFLIKNFKSKLRSQIRKAEKNDLIFHWGDDACLDDFYYVFSRNMHTLGSPVHSRDLFRAVLQHCKGNVKMGLVYLQEKPVGAGLLLMKGNSVSIPWASTLRKYNSLAPNMLLYWHFLKYSADNEYTLFDFGRSTKQEGTYKFKTQWGAKPTPLDWYNLHLRPNRIVEDTEAGMQNRSLYAEIWQKLPLSLANYLGPKIRKFISL